MEKREPSCTTDGMQTGAATLENSVEAPQKKIVLTSWNLPKKDLIKIKSFCTAKETINKTNKQPMEEEKIFSNDILDKGLVSKTYKGLAKFNT